MNKKDEVGMAGPKSTQTRFVTIITSTKHPIPMLAFSVAIWGAGMNQPVMQQSTDRAIPPHES
jgi:hypothetical protein